MSDTCIVLVTGVAGSGKTTIGTRVAERLGWPYFEGDDFHPPANRARMAQGLPLDELDRAPWLAALRARIDEVQAAGRCAVLSCSALRAVHRETLTRNVEHLLLVHLAGDYDTLHRRVAGRTGHWFEAPLLRSQFEALEPPADALTLDVREPVDALVDRIVAAVGR